MKQKLVPILSVVVGILAGLLTYRFLQRERQKVADKLDEIYRGAQKVQVVAASEPIPGGTVIKARDLKLVDIFEASMPERVVLRTEGRLLLGRKTMTMIGANRPILWSDIEGGETRGSGLARSVRPGMRALSLSIAGAAAVSSMVRPNDHVDVLGTFTFPAADGGQEMETTTLTVLQDVTVVATGQETATAAGGGRRRPGSSYSTVTLEVTPQEAEVLVFAEQAKGRLTLSLRNPQDIWSGDLPSIDFGDLPRRLGDLNRERQRFKRDL